MLNIFCCKENNDSSSDEDDEIEIQNSSDTSGKLIFKGSSRSWLLMTMNLKNVGAHDFVLKLSFIFF